MMISLIDNLVPIAKALRRPAFGPPRRAQAVLCTLLAAGTLLAPAVQAACPATDAPIVHHYTFDSLEKGLLRDSGGGLDARSASVNETAGVVGRAVLVDERSEIMIDNFALPATPGITLTAWVRPDRRANEESRILSQASGTAPYAHQVMLGTYDGGALRFRLRVNGRTHTLISPKGLLEPSRWSFVAFSHDGQHMRIWHDGKLVAERAAAGTPVRDAAMPTAIGDQPPGAGERSFVGAIDELRIYGSALDASTLVRLRDWRGERCGASAANAEASAETPVTAADAGSCSADDEPARTALLHRFPLDTVANGALADTAGGRAATASRVSIANGRVDGAVQLERASRLTVDPVALVGARALTLSAWIRPEPGGHVEARLFSWAGNLADSGHALMASAYGNGRLRFRLRASGSTTTLYSRPDRLESGVWSFVAFTWDGEMMRIYDDGELVAESAKRGRLEARSSWRAAIGNQPSGAGDRPYVGLIDELRVHSRALDRDELMQLQALPDEGCETGASDGSLASAAAPAAPAPIELTALNESRVSFAWPPVTDADAYRVRRNGKELAHTEDTVFLDDGVVAGSYYSYAVTAVRADGNGELESAAGTLDVSVPERAGKTAEGTSTDASEPPVEAASPEQDTDGSGDAAGSTPPPSGRDDEYGTQIAAGQCPAIPGSFSKSYRVSSYAGFADAYKRARPGEAVIIESGTYNWTSNASTKKWKMIARPIVLDRSGTPGKPIYIIAEKPGGVVFRANSSTFVLAGRHQVLAGFTFRDATTGTIFVDGPDNRVACNRIEQGRGLLSIAHQGAHRTEIDNNLFVGGDRYVMMAMRCMQTKSFCTDNSKYFHIHHNTWRDKPFAGSNGHEAIILGLGYTPASGVRIYNDDGPEGTNMHALIENNLFDGWNGENELISVKSGGNVIRNNCIVDSPAAGIKIRIGYDNLVTGNWFENSGHSGQEISGQRNFFAFNYYSHAKRSIQLANGERYASSYSGGKYADLLRYISADDNVVRNNVFGRTQHMVSVNRRFGSTASFAGAPKSNVLEDNVYMTTGLSGTNDRGGYRSGDGKYSESAFRKNNEWGYNQVVDQVPPPGRCGDASVFNGPGGPNATVSGSPMLYGPHTRIKAPSWW